MKTWCVISLAVLPFLPISAPAAQVTVSFTGTIEGWNVGSVPAIDSFSGQMFYDTAETMTPGPPSPPIDVSFAGPLTRPSDGLIVHLGPYTVSMLGQPYTMMGVNHETDGPPGGLDMIEINNYKAQGTSTLPGDPVPSTLVVGIPGLDGFFEPATVPPSSLNVSDLYHGMILPGGITEFWGGLYLVTADDFVFGAIDSIQVSTVNATAPEPSTRYLLIAGGLGVALFSARRLRIRTH